jgi:hypothetical protein
VGKIVHFRIDKIRSHREQIQPSHFTKNEFKVQSVWRSHSWLIIQHVHIPGPSVQFSYDALYPAQWHFPLILYLLLLIS